MAKTTKLYDYGDSPESHTEQIHRHDVRQSAPSGWMLALVAISIAFGIFLLGLGTLALYLRYRYG